MTARMAEEQYNTKSHDVGFMINCSYGNGYRITGREDYRQVLVNAGNSLATRFSPETGCIRSWSPRNGWDYIVIIDNMMNLETAHGGIFADRGQHLLQTLRRAMLT